MNFNFELILFYAVVISGVIALFDRVFLEKKRRLAHANTPPDEIKLPVIIDYARSFFPVLLLVFLLRSFIYEPFRIPSGSLEPTLPIGDFILVNKFHYGVRLPVVYHKIFSNHSPERGDIIVFRWPPNPSVDFIKRVIGVPGDHIDYINKTLYINGKEIPQTFIANTKNRDESGRLWDVIEKKENIFGIEHAIYQNDARLNEDIHDIVVPEGMFFAMGDNRDSSADSRAWGFVPEANIVGKANYVWMSWDSNDYKVRWNRIGKAIH
jgi:signal peptidase I